MSARNIFHASQLWKGHWTKVSEILIEWRKESSLRNNTAEEQDEEEEEKYKTEMSLEMKSSIGYLLL